MNPQPQKVEFAFQAIDIAGDVVCDTIERINMYLPKLVEHSAYRSYIQVHFDFLANRIDPHNVARYYSVLQSFMCDFQMSVNTIAREAVQGYRKSSDLVSPDSQVMASSAVDLLDHLFIKNAELNPYLCFSRGHLSAYTVASLAIVNLQLALAYELLHQTNVHGDTFLATTYKESVENKVFVNRCQ